MTNPRKLLIASGNRAKASEIITILSAGLADLDVEFLTMANFPEALEPDENGTTYIENAAIKSEAASKHTGLIALGDDVGLEIDYLDGQPGLYSRRFAGEDTPFSIKIALILEKLKDVPDEQRTARFQAAVAISAPNIPTRIFEASRDGRITHDPKGEHGFGYDPIFYLPELNKTMAELLPEEKNQTSHRSRVLSHALPYLRELLGGK